jgi:hypothetical protein
MNELTAEKRLNPLARGDIAFQSVRDRRIEQSVQMQAQQRKHDGGHRAHGQRQ